MTKSNITNTAASVKQRLLNRARAQKEDFNLLLTKYALERVLYRISQSPHKNIFVLKGALFRSEAASSQSSQGSKGRLQSTFDQVRPRTGSLPYQPITAQKYIRFEGRTPLRDLG